MSRHELDIGAKLANRLMILLLPTDPGDAENGGFIVITLLILNEQFVRVYESNALKTTSATRNSIYNCFLFFWATSIFMLFNL